MKYERGSLVLGPAFSRHPPIWRYTQYIERLDGEILHIIEHPDGEIKIALDEELAPVPNRDFFPLGNKVCHKVGDSVSFFCTVGNADDTENRIKALNIANYLNNGGEPWTIEFHNL